MIFDKEGNTVTVLQENISLNKFLENLTKAYPKIKSDHIIVNLFTFSRLSTNDLLEFLQLSNKHRGAGTSFVLVTDEISYEDLPDELCVVPTRQEAMDIIEMEEIERDLGI